MGGSQDKARFYIGTDEEYNTNDPTCALRRTLLLVVKRVVRAFPENL